MLSNCKFKTISEIIKSGDLKFNLIGNVRLVDQEVKKLRDDYFLKFQISDASKSAMQITFFFKDVSAADLINVGNIFICIGLRRQCYNDTVMGKANLYDNAFICCVFPHGETNQLPIDMRTLRRVPPGFIVPDTIKDTLSLFVDVSDSGAGGKKRRLDNGQGQSYNATTSVEGIKDIENGSLVNLVAKVVDMNHSANHVVLKLWDGTGEAIWDPHQRAVTVCTTINLTIWSDAFHSFESLELYQWVYLTHLKVQWYKGKELKYMFQSSIQVLSPEDPRVETALQSHQKKIDKQLNIKDEDSDNIKNIPQNIKNNNKNNNDNHNSINNNGNSNNSSVNSNNVKDTGDLEIFCASTVVDLKTPHFTSIKDIIEYNSPNIFVANVKLHEIFPNMSRRWMHVLCESCLTFQEPLPISLIDYNCKKCESGDKVKWVYCLNLIVADEANELKVILSRDDALYFFNQTDINTKETVPPSHKDAQQIINKLLTSNEMFPICIRSYRRPNNPNMLYQIYRTKYIMS